MGITYTLNEENYNNAKQIKKSLADNFYKAIKTTISTESQYQQEKWSPIKLHQNWNPKNFDINFISTQNIKTKVISLRQGINNKIPQRIVGPKNSGKTRLAHEIFKKIDDTLLEDPILNQVLYYDLDNKHYRAIESQLFELSSLNQRKVLILDNCPLDTHKKIYNEFLHNTEVSLLTIGNPLEKEGASISLTEDYSNEIIKHLSTQGDHPKNADYVLHSANGDLNSAIVMLSSVSEEEDNLFSKFKLKWKQILGESLFSEKVIHLLEELALVTHLGYDNFHQSQIEILVLDKYGITKEELNEYIKLLAEKGIVKTKGDFVLLDAFVEELASKRLERLVTENLIEYLERIKNGSLSVQFSERLLELSDLPGTKKIIDILTTEGGLLTKYEFIDTSQGGKILLKFAEIDPRKVLNALNISLDSKTSVQLLDFKTGRRNLVWALERLVYREETFNGAANILFKLAVSENEGIGNNATAQFCQLFQAHLPATSVSLEERVKFIDSLLKNIKDGHLAVIKKALNRALQTQGFSSMMGAEKQGGKIFHNYNPKSKAEEQEYWKSIISFLEVIDGHEILVNNFNSQMRKGNSYAIMEAVEKIVDKTGKLDKDLRQEFEFALNNAFTSPPIIDRINNILEKYSANTLKEELEFKVALPPYSPSRDENNKLINLAEGRALQFADELIQTGENDWLDEIDVLAKNEQRQTFAFGAHLAKLKPEYQELFNVFIDKLAKTPREEQNNRLAAGYLSASENREFKQHVIDLYLANPEISYHAIHLTRFLEIEIGDLEKLYKLIETKDGYVVGLQYIKINKLSDQEFISFIIWLCTIEPYGWWVAIELSETNLEKRKEISDPIYSMIRDLLMKKDILQGKNSHSPFSLSQYYDLLHLYVKNKFDDELGEFLAHEIVVASMEVTSSTQEIRLKDILELLLDSKWDLVWPIFSENILDENNYSYKLLQFLKSYRSYNESNILNWLDTCPQMGPQVAVRFVRLFEFAENKEHWTSLGIKMLDRFYYNISFLSQVKSNLHNFSWSGSLVPLLKSRKGLAEVLIDHNEEEIKIFAKEQIEYFENRIEEEKKYDQNNGLEG